MTLTLAVILILGGFYGAIFWRISRSLKDRGRLRLQMNKLRFKYVNEAFGGIKETKVLNRLAYFFERYSSVSLKQAQLMSWNAVIGQIPRFAFEAFAFGGIIFFVLIMLVVGEDTRQVIPLASLFALAGYRLLPALQELFSSFTEMQFNRAVLDRIYSDFKRVTDDDDIALLPEKHLSEAVMPFKEKITLDLVSYKYPNASEYVIKDLSINIWHNTAVALVGATGAGKTTLVDIILGLLPPQQGSIKVDDIIVNRHNVRAWQQLIGYVPQHIYLSDDTIGGNIAFGVSETYINQDAIVEAARIANLHEFIVNELPNGYNTVVGERGIRLSGGQRQRIGIARALYHNPEVLIFDEATSALDGITEDAVLEAMDRASKMKTMIIIAHRLTTVKNCDLIYLLNRGRIVASGTYEQLYRSNTEFQKMAKLKL